MKNLMRHGLPIVLSLSLLAVVVVETQTAKENQRLRTDIERLQGNITNMATTCECRPSSVISKCRQIHEGEVCSKLCINSCVFAFLDREKRVLSCEDRAADVCICTPENEEE